MKGTKSAFLKLLETGRFSIQAEKDLMATREDAKSHGRTSSDLRKKGKGAQANKNLGAVKCFSFANHALT